MSHSVRRRIAVTGFLSCKNDFTLGTSLESKPMGMAKVDSNWDQLKTAKKQHSDLYNTQYSSSYNTQYSNLSSIFYSSFKPFYSPDSIASKFERKARKPTLPSLYKKNVCDVDFGFKSITTRTTFARKIYFTALVQLGVLLFLQYLPHYCGLKIGLGAENKMIKDFDGFGKPLQYTVLLISLITTVTLTVSEFHRRYPWNYISLAFFTLSVGILWMISQNHYGTKFFLFHLAFAIACLFIYTCQTLFRYSVSVGVVMVLLVGGGSFITMDNTWYGEIWETYYYKTYIWADLLSTLIMLFFVVDIHFMVSGTHLNGIYKHEWVFATISLYTDCVNLCIWFLQILNAAKR